MTQIYFIAQTVGTCLIVAVCVWLVPSLYQCTVKFSCIDLFQFTIVDAERSRGYEGHAPPTPLLLCNAVACPHLERSAMGTACSRSASAHLYHAGSRLLPCDGAAD